MAAAQILATVLVAVVARLLLHHAIDSVVSSSIERAAARDAQSPRLTERLLATAGPDRGRHRRRLSTTGRCCAA